MAEEHEIVNISDNDDDCILEAVLRNSEHNVQKDVYDSIYKECPPLAKIIEKCLHIENSEGMARVVNKTLLRMYKDADEKYKKSSEFEKVLHKTSVCLDNDPFHRFSHIKVLCDVLKSNKHKKRIQLTTLKTNINDKKISRLSLKRNSSLERKVKFLKSDIIDLDTFVNPVVIECDSENFERNECNSENVVCNDTPIVIEDEKENKTNVQNDSLDGECSERLLLPYKLLNAEEDRNPKDLEKIQEIERQIAKYKEMIIKLDEEEVLDDDTNSPYIRSERLKAKIVLLYEELCQYTDTKPVKNREIRLQAIDGHPKGPIKRLENFLNKNIGSNGYPLFPDFCDVVKCVIKSNIKDKLGWSKQQVLKEASALFTHCGRALQKRRQERELGDLLSRVKCEKLPEDPADDDPELRARLEANMKHAIKKEAEILERFSMMQSLPPQKSVPVNNNHRDVKDLSENEFVDENLITTKEKSPVRPINTEVNVNEEAKNKASNEKLEAICIADTEDSSSYKSDSDEESSSDECQINNLTENINTEVSSIINQPPTNELLKMDIKSHVNNLNLSAERSTESRELGFGKNIVDVEFNEVKVKKEPTEEIAQLLNELGDNYTVSIIDVEDPFLVIEISDSSDEHESEYP